MPDLTNYARLVPQHLLARRAADLSRQIYSSLPWGYRIAELLMVLAVDTREAFARTMFAEMLLAGVRGLPEVNGKPASEWLQVIQRKGPNSLPAGTGQEFANRTFKILLAKLGSDADLASDAMSNVLFAAARRKLRIANGSSVRDAESYLITACLNAARDILRARARRREDSLVRDWSDREIDVTDPEAFRSLEQSVGRGEIARILQDAARISPRAREYLEVVLRGDSQSDWARDLGVTDAAVSKLVRKLRPQLVNILREHLRPSVSAMRTSYDFR